MRSFDAPSGRTYFHDGDMSPRSDVQFEMATREIPMADILALAAEYIRYRRIAALEQATDEELLGLPSTPPTPSTPHVR
jgi:hypothetical protein